MHHRCFYPKTGQLAHPQWKLKKKVACGHRLESLDPRHSILHPKCEEIPREVIPREEIPAIHSHVGPNHRRIKKSAPKPHLLSWAKLFGRRQRHRALRWPTDLLKNVKC
jgi:hypothetical protein